MCVQFTTYGKPERQLLKLDPQILKWPLVSLIQSILSIKCFCPIFWNLPSVLILFFASSCAFAVTKYVMFLLTIWVSWRELFGNKEMIGPGVCGHTGSASERTKLFASQNHQWRWMYEVYSKKNAVLTLKGLNKHSYWLTWVPKLLRTHES